MTRRILFLTATFLVSYWVEAQINADSLTIPEDMLLLSNKIGFEQFNQGQISDPIRLIQGKIPGLLTSRFDGDPNTLFDFVIRGFNTLQGNRQPLVVIDGTVGLRLDAIDPMDIADIQVLKGSEAARFGVLGNNGVILVNTKAPADGKLNVTYHSQYQRVSPDSPLEVLGASEFLREGGPDLGGNNTNWFDELTERSWGMSQHVAISSRQDKATYRASVTYRDRPGIVQGHGQSSINTHFRMTQNMLNEKIRLTVGLNHMSRETSSVPLEVFRHAISYNPTAPVFEESEQFGGYFQESSFFDFYNPIAIRDQTSNEEAQSLSQYHVDLSWNINSNLKFEGSLGQYLLRNNESSYVSRFSLFAAGTDQLGIASRSTQETNFRSAEAAFNYTLNIGNYLLETKLGTFLQGTRQDQFGVMVNNFQLDAFGVDNLFAAIDRTGFFSSYDSFRSREVVQSYYGSLGAGTGLFNLTLNLRNGGYSGFGENEKRASFLEVSTNLHLHEVLTLRAGTALTLTGGYGQSGNLPVAPYLSQPLFRPVGGARSNDEHSVSYFLIQGNPDLSTERRNTVDIGARLSTLQGNLQVSLNYFNQTFKDLLYHTPIPNPFRGFREQWLNIGEASNTGLEYAVDYRFDLGDFKVGSSLVGTFYKRPTLDKLGNDEISFDLVYPPVPFRNTIALEVGQSIGNFRGEVVERVDNNGSFVFRDFNNDGRIDLSDDRIIGNGIPSAQIGWNTSIQWKEWDLNLFFRGVYGHDILNTYRLHYGGRDQASNVWNTVVVDGPRIEDVPRYSSFFLESGNFTRLDNLTISFRPAIVEKVLQSLRIYVTMTNPLLFTNYQGVSPEVRYQRGGSHLLIGIEDRNVYFPTKSFTLGLEIRL